MSLVSLWCVVGTVVEAPNSVWVGTVVERWLLSDGTWCVGCNLNNENPRGAKKPGKLKPLILPAIPPFILLYTVPCPAETHQDQRNKLTHSVHFRHVLLLLLLLLLLFFVLLLLLFFFFLPLARIFP
jgi:hypothetical protein